MATRLHHIVGRQLVNLSFMCHKMSVDMMRQRLLVCAQSMVPHPKNRRSTGLLTGAPHQAGLPPVYERRAHQLWRVVRQSLVIGPRLMRQRQRREHATRQLQTRRRWLRLRLWQGLQSGFRRQRRRDSQKRKLRCKRKLLHVASFVHFSRQVVHIIAHHTLIMSIMTCRGTLTLLNTWCLVHAKQLEQRTGLVNYVMQQYKQQRRVPRMRKYYRRKLQKAEELLDSVKQQTLRFKKLRTLLLFWYRAGDNGCMAQQLSLFTSLAEKVLSDLPQVFNAYSNDPYAKDQALERTAYLLVTEYVGMCVYVFTYGGYSDNAHLLHDLMKKTMLRFTNNIGLGDWYEWAVRYRLPSELLVHSRTAGPPFDVPDMCAAPEVLLNKTSLFDTCAENFVSQRIQRLFKRQNVKIQIPPGRTLLLGSLNYKMMDPDTGKVIGMFSSPQDLAANQKLQCVVDVPATPS